MYFSSIIRLLSYFYFLFTDEKTEGHGSNLTSQSLLLTFSPLFLEGNILKESQEHGFQNKTA